MSMIERFREWRDSKAEQRAAREEMQFHIEQETERNIRHGMTPADARRAAVMAFGSVDRFAEVARDERTGTRFADFKASWLDWKLGFRMLLKYPGLSLIGGITLAAAMALGAGWFEFSWEMRDPDLPLPDGDRIVRVENWDAAAGDVEPRSIHDFLAWREQLTSIEQFGAYRDVERNLITADGRALPQKLAEISPVAFDLTRVPPLLGRPLTEADAEPGAPDVIVIGYDLWQKRFNGDHAVIGRTVQLGRIQTTIVGVMPEDYQFPINHQLWAPLRLTETAPRTGAAISMFGRLANGVSIEAAQAELSTIASRVAEANPGTHTQLRARVLPYGAPTEGIGELVVANIVAWLILAIASINVATLMFARTALRESEIVVRNALGASRLRVMGQLFAESLVLNLVAAALGLFALTRFMNWARSDAISDVDWPFWWDLTLGPATILYTGALAVFGAVIVGLLPALRATGPKVQAQLRNIGGGGTNMQVGAVWTVLIIVQVALSVIGLPIGIASSREALAERNVRASFESAPYLTFRPDVDRDAVPGTTAEIEGEAVVARMVTVIEELERRLENEPAVASVTFAEALPGVYHPLARLEVQRGTETPTIVDTNIESDRVRMSTVDVGFFETFRVPLIAGRSFHSGDVGAANGVIIINEALAKNIGGNPVGVRVRTVTAYGPEERSPWLEIVGVVRDLGLDPTGRGESDFLFMPASVGTLSRPPHVAIRLHGDARAFEPQLRALAAQVAPDLRLYDVLPLTEVIRKYDFPNLLGTFVAIGVALLVLLLSAAGLFALMSVAVARRTREIGIRLAIGANPRAVLAALFKRTATQLGIGILIGNILVLLLLSVIVDELQLTIAAVPMLVASLVMAAVGFAACFVPARRALRVQPTEALKEA